MALFWKKSHQAEDAAPHPEEQEPVNVSTPAEANDDDAFLSSLKELIGYTDASDAKASIKPAPREEAKAAFASAMSDETLVADLDTLLSAAEKASIPQKKAPSANAQPVEVNEEDAFLSDLKGLIGVDEETPVPVQEDVPAFQEETPAPNVQPEETDEEDTFLSDLKGLIGAEEETPAPTQEDAPAFQEETHAPDVQPEETDEEDNFLSDLKGLIGAEEETPAPVQEDAPAFQEETPAPDVQPEETDEEDAFLSDLKGLIGAEEETPAPIQEDAPASREEPPAPSEDIPPEQEITEANPASADLHTSDAVSDDELLAKVDQLIAPAEKPPVSAKDRFEALSQQPQKDESILADLYNERAPMSDEEFIADVKKLLVPVEEKAAPAQQEITPEPPAPPKRRPRPERPDPEKSAKAPAQPAKAPSRPRQQQAARPRNTSAAKSAAPAAAKKAPGTPKKPAAAPAKKAPSAEPKRPAPASGKQPAPAQAPRKRPTSGQAPRKPAAPAPKSAQAVTTAAKKNPAQAPANRRRKPLNRWYLLLVLWISCALPELLLHLSTASGPTALFSSGLLLPLLFALVPALIIYTVTLVLPNQKANHIITIVYSGIIFVLCASQLIYYRVFGTFYSAYSMTNGGQILQFWNIILVRIWENLLLLLLMALPFIFSFLARRYFSFRALKQWKLGLPPLAAAIVVQLLLVLCLPIFGGTAPMSAYDLYHHNTDSYFSVNRLGLLTAFRLDAVRMMTGFQPSGTMQLGDPTVPSETEEATTPAATQPNYDTSPNVLPLDFDNLISNARSESIREVHQYFNQRTPSNKNAYTGLFKGSNLILITAESFDYLAVSQERTPTLYKLMHEGVYFTDYYVPDWGVSTTDGEYAFLTSTIPKSGVWSFYQSSKNYMPLPISRQLIALGYAANAYHGHDYKFYDRNLYLPNLGFNYKGQGNGLNTKVTWPESDVEVVDLTTADYVHNEPFVTYYMTISGHQIYNFSDNYIAGQNRALVADEPYSDNVRAYLATQIELEKSMELLLERLEEAGVLENTVIVMTADHYPNGLTPEELSELAGHEIDTDFEIYKNGCIIYKPGMTPVTIDAPCSHLDLLPTLLNLFGINFDSRLYMGRDVFSDAAPLVIFRNRSWITDVAKYNSNTDDVFYTTAAGAPSDDYPQRIKNEVANRITVSARILENNYWDILF